MKREIVDKIIALIPSSDLRKRIAETGFVMTDAELLTTVYRCAPTYGSLLEHLRLLADEFPRGLKAYANKLIKAERREMERFLDPNGAVYELRIASSPEYGEDKCFCPTFSDAVSLAKVYIKEESDWIKRPEDCYMSVTRHALLTAETEAPFDYRRTDFSRVRLLPDGSYGPAWVNALDIAGCDGCCYKCRRKYCVDSREVEYPVFAGMFDVVRYFDWDGCGYGVIGSDWGGPVCEAYYVLPLKREVLDFGDMHRADMHLHEHVPPPFVTVIQKDELPEYCLEPYEKWIGFLKDVFAERCTGAKEKPASVPEEKR